MDQLNKSTNFLDVKFDLKKLDTQVNDQIKVDKKDEKIVVKNEKESNDKEKKIPNRCSICKKKLLLAMTFDCPCDETKRYCGTHRFPEEHECTKEKDKIKLIKVVADKIQKI